MRLLSGFLLVLAFLAVSACTGSDTTTIVERTLCSTTGEILEEGETCPPPVVQQPPPTDQNQPDQDTTCNISVTGLMYIAGTGDERVCGNEKDNVILGREGDDSLFGKAGNDTLHGMTHRDKLYGEDGNDTLIGGEHQDLLDGGDGIDTVDYGKEQTGITDRGTTPDATNLLLPDTSNSGAVAVEVDLAGGTATDTYGDRDTLKDVENVVGTSLADEIRGDNKANRIDGGGGDDLIEARGGNDEVVFDSTDATTPPDGGEGRDTLIVTGGTPPSLATHDTFEDLKDESSSGDIDLTGDNRDNVLTGGKGANVLIGGGGDDTLKGEGGDDTLVGGEGKDTLTGGEGDDCFEFTAPAVVTYADSANITAEEKATIETRKTTIRATTDTVRDFKAGDTIYVAGGSAKIVSGKVLAIIVAADATVTPPVREISEDLARVNGLAAGTELETSACAR